MFFPQKINKCSIRLVALHQTIWVSSKCRKMHILLEEACNLRLSVRKAEPIETLDPPVKQLSPPICPWSVQINMKTPNQVFKIDSTNSCNFLGTESERNLSLKPSLYMVRWSSQPCTSGQVTSTVWSGCTKCLNAIVAIILNYHGSSKHTASCGYLYVVLSCTSRYLAQQTAEVNTS